MHASLDSVQKSPHKVQRIKVFVVKLGHNALMHSPDKRCTSKHIIMLDTVKEQLHK